MEILLLMAFSIDCPNQSDFNKVLVELSSKFNNPPSWVGKVAALLFVRAKTSWLNIYHVHVRTNCNRSLTYQQK